MTNSKLDVAGLETLTDEEAKDRNGGSFIGNFFGGLIGGWAGGLVLGSPGSAIGKALGSYFLGLFI